MNLHGYPQMNRLWITMPVEEKIRQNLRYFPFGQALSTGNPQ
jgi:hypothetical protein